MPYSILSNQFGELELPKPRVSGRDAMNQFRPGFLVQIRLGPKRGVLTHHLPRK
jgi:hypothetical protein